MKFYASDVSDAIQRKDHLQQPRLDFCRNIPFSSEESEFNDGQHTGIRELLYVINNAIDRCFLDGALVDILTSN